MCGLVARHFWSQLSIGDTGGNVAACRPVGSGLAASEPMPQLFGHKKDLSAGPNPIFLPLGLGFRDRDLGGAAVPPDWKGPTFTCLAPPCSEAGKAVCRGP